MRPITICLSVASYQRYCTPRIGCLTTRFIHSRSHLVCSSCQATSSVLHSIPATARPIARMDTASRVGPFKEFHGRGRVLEECRFSQAERLPYTRSRMDVHLIDGTYELFRHFYAVPSAQDMNGREIGAVRAVLRSVLSMIEQGATHIGVATDHVVESFRNDLYAGYKTSAGVPPTLLSQFPVLEEALDAMGVMVWPMVEYEADDAIASAASKAAEENRIRQVVLCTPDKDLAQCVRGTRVVQLDRRRGILRDEAGVEASSV